MPNIIEITDFHDAQLDVYARLTEAQLMNRFDPKNAMFIAESPKVIQRALDAGYEPVSILVERTRMIGESLDVIRRCEGVPVYTADMDVLTQLTGYRLTRGLLCAMRRKPLLSVETVLEGTRRVAVLEEVMNPTNIGAIFRSAAALGMDAVLLTPGCSDPLYRRSARVSMGTVFQVPWTFLPENWLQVLRDHGYQSAAMALSDNSISVDDPCLEQVERLAVVLGTEGDGLAESTVTNCDFTVKIPMYHGVDSLNVAAASAVAFWQLRAK